MALRAHDERTGLRLLARSASHRQENQSQRRSAFERLGQTGVITEKAEGTIIKVIELSSQGKAGAEYPSEQPH
jgi:hypothetical protein